mgnify:CR=1 FL=1
MIEVQGNILSFSAFLYDDIGNATWYLSSGPLNADGSYVGTLQEMTNGQTLSGLYQAPDVKRVVSNIDLKCSTSTTCTLTWAGLSVPIQRFVF